MSVLFADPGLIENAAQDLAGIHSSLGEAVTAAEQQTTSVLPAAADEISAAVAALFGTHAQEFQAVNSQAAAFHNEFVQLLNSGAGSYLAAEAASVPTLGGGVLSGGALQQAVSGLESSVAGAFSSLGSPALLLGGTGTGHAAAVGPYETLFANTSANLQALGNAIAANPAPLLRQIVANQIGYANQLGTGLQNFFAGFPANLPTAVDSAVAYLTTFPNNLAQWLINSVQLESTVLHNIATTVQTGLPGFTTNLQSAFQALLAGDTSGATSDFEQALVSLIQPGVDIVPTNVDISIGITRITIEVAAGVVPTGLIGDVFAAAAVPGQISQGFTNLLPIGSVPAEIAQNITNEVKAATNTGIDVGLSIDAKLLPPPPSITAGGTATFGLPLALTLDAVGAPIVTAQAFQSSATAFTTALQTGNIAGAFDTLVDAPAVIENALLNGQSTLPLTVGNSGLGLTVDFPVDGLLVPTGPYGAVVDLGTLGLGTIPIEIGGTPLGGLIPGLLVYAPEQLAESIGA